MPPKLAEALEKLQEDVVDLSRNNREERFGWVIICVILVDVIWFRNAPNPAFPIAILILELAALFILARRLRLPDILTFIQLLIARAQDNRGGG